MNPRFVPCPVAISWRGLHEGAGHVAAATVLDVPVDSSRLHANGGGSTWILGGSARERLLVALAGNAAERLFGVHDSDVRCSLTDYQKAFRYGIEIAREEEHEHRGRDRHEDEGGQKPVSFGPRLMNPTSSLTALDVAGVERNASRVAERIAARWVARAGVLVDAGEREVFELLGRNRRLCRRIAEALEKHGRLDGEEIAAFIEHDARREA